MAEITESSNAGKIRGIVFGPPGNTKTASSVTLSEFCPADWTHIRLTEPPKREMVSLDDMLYISFDTQATLGFNQLGVKVPQIDLSNVGGKLFEELKAAPKLVADKVKEGKTKTVVVDTVSALDEMITLAHASAGLAKFDLYREVLLTHMRFAMALKAIDANMLFLCHAKVASDTESDSKAGEKMAANAAKKQSAWGTGEIIPAITGAALNHYRRDSSFIFSVSKASVAVNGKPQVGFFFHSHHQKFDTKSRLILPEMMPADWREVKKWL